MVKALSVDLLQRVVDAVASGMSCRAAAARFVAAAPTFGLGQVLLAIVRPLWAKLAIAAVFVAPAVIAGYHAVHGIVKHTMPSEFWQITFSIIGAAAVGASAFLRVAGLATGRPAGNTAGSPMPAGASLQGTPLEMSERKLYIVSTSREC